MTGPIPLDPVTGHIRRTLPDGTYLASVGRPRGGQTRIGVQRCRVLESELPPGLVLIEWWDGEAVSVTHEPSGDSIGFTWYSEDDDGDELPWTALEQARDALRETAADLGTVDWTLPRSILGTDPAVGSLIRELRPLAGLSPILPIREVAS